VQIQLSGLSSEDLGRQVTVTSLTGGSIWDENSFNDPEKVSLCDDRIKNGKAWFLI
jgi:hypothetical protein